MCSFLRGDDFMTGRERSLLFWALLIALALIVMIWLRGILLPFVAGAALAYFLDPVADRLEKLGLSRLVATSFILLVFALITLIVVVTIIPILIRELSEVIKGMPGYIETIRGFIGYYYQALFGTELAAVELGFEETMRKITNNSSLQPGVFLRQLWDGGLALVNTISLVVITPVVAFYLLLDWDRMTARVDSWLPRDHLQTLRSLAGQIDRTLNGFVRGQVTVCFILAVVYSVGLLLVGLNHGLLIGVTAGILSFIPYVGSAIGLVLSAGMAVTQFWPEWVPILMVLAVFFTGQLLEGNILQPKIVGEKVNLHPVWLIFALFVFGYLMGFVGMLVAVPLAATIGVIVRFLLDHYLDSDFYKGKKGS